MRAPPLRYAILGTVTLLVVGHLIGQRVSESYAKHSSLADLKFHAGLTQDPLLSTWSNGNLAIHGGTPSQHHHYASPDPVANVSRANAAFVLLTRNSDLYEVLTSIRQIEDRFNRKYNYPYVFLNDEPFTDDFKAHVSAMASGATQFGIVPASDWSDVPDWIDEDRAKAAREKMEADQIIYGGSVTYRRMCRFFSKFVHKQPLVAQYDFYWRLDPNVKFFCDLDYDPFLWMQENNKKYGWTISIKEYESTIPTLWKTTKAFMDKHPEHLPEDNLLDWVSNDKGETYNLCHWWSNFELASIEFLNSKAYTDYVEALDRAGGFYYERWGDAPVHSIAAALFLKKEEIHFFQDIGYRHEPFQQCPKGATDRCSCDPQDSFEDHWYSCTPAFQKLTADVFH